MQIQGSFTHSLASEVDCVWGNSKMWRSARTQLWKIKRRECGVISVLQSVCEMPTLCISSKSRACLQTQNKTARCKRKILQDFGHWTRTRNTRKALWEKYKNNSCKRRASLPWHGRWSADGWAPLNSNPIKELALPMYNQRSKRNMSARDRHDDQLTCERDTSRLKSNPEPDSFSFSYSLCSSCHRDQGLMCRQGKPPTSTAGTWGSH